MLDPSNITKLFLKYILLVIISGIGLCLIFFGHKYLGLAVVGMAWFVSNLYNMNWSEVNLSNFPKHFIDHLTKNKKKNKS